MKASPYRKARKEKIAKTKLVKAKNDSLSQVKMEERTN
jgi:hypothetical protein